MTVPSELSHVEYTGNGVTTAFAVPFRFLEDTHLGVYLKVLATGGRSQLMLDSDYTVSGAGENDGGTVTTVLAYSALYEIDIERTVPITQETDYAPNDPFPAESHEDALDKLTMICQQLEYAIELLDQYIIDEPNSRRHQVWGTVISPIDIAVDTGTKRGRLVAPYDFTLVGVACDLGTTQTSGSIITVDLNKNGASILSTKMTIPNGSTKSTAGVAPVLTTTIVLAGDELSFDIDQIGDGTAKWLQAMVWGYQT